ncbi:hypothetical protein G7Y89_g3370 [Cudoniella acicularis]|uniref:Alpha/beta hydrolase fold-3 domain-containing protein n=1 Tax=Cudoniella acicularis TaxID=354080 RepID=A0A8H4RST6_9HELO|nr:hypothetical protein G7Y89_g3370 [Cudoniella acicularis]
MAPKQQPPATWSHTPVELSIREKVGLFFFGIIGFIKAIVSFSLALPLNRDFSRKTLLQKFIVKVAQNIAGSPSLTFRQLLSLQKPSGQTIAKTCTLQNLAHNTITIDADPFPPAALHFIDSTPDQPGNVLLYFHGGGYIFPASAGHVKFSHLCAKTANASLAMLEYTLAPGLKYPGQLAQAVAAIRFLLKTHTPNQIIIGGDSAGGNLSLAILSHLRDPHPSIPPILRGNGGLEKVVLKAAMCISPRCANTRETPSYVQNRDKDIILPAFMDLFAQAWQPNIEEVWATPNKGSVVFWGTICAEKVLLAAGSDEVYVDDIRRLGELIGVDDEGKREGGRVVELVVCEGEVHTQVVLDTVMGFRDGVMLKRVLEWVERL